MLNVILQNVNSLLNADHLIEFLDIVYTLQPTHLACLTETNFLNNAKESSRKTKTESTSDFENEIAQLGLNK